jgi:hypothetical protein
MTIPRIARNHAPSDKVGLPSGEFSIDHDQGTIVIARNINVTREELLRYFSYNKYLSFVQENPI